MSFPFHEFGITRLFLEALKEEGKAACCWWWKKYDADLGSKGLQLYQSSQHVARVANSAIREPKHTERLFLFLITLLSIINRKPTENKNTNCRQTQKPIFRL